MISIIIETFMTNIVNIHTRVSFRFFICKENDGRYH